MYVCMYVCMYVHLFQILREGADIITGIPIHCKSCTRCGRRGGGGERRGEEGMERRGEEEKEGKVMGMRQQV